MDQESEKPRSIKILQWVYASVSILALAFFSFILIASFLMIPQVGVEKVLRDLLIVFIASLVVPIFWVGLLTTIALFASDKKTVKLIKIVIKFLAGIALIIGVGYFTFSGVWTLVELSRNCPGNDVNCGVGIIAFGYIPFVIILIVPLTLFSISALNKYLYWLEYSEQRLKTSTINSGVPQNVPSNS